MQLSLERYVFSIMENHFRLQECLGDHSWQFDMDAGEVAFLAPGTKRCLARCPVQILGTISHVSGSWLWGWANSKSNIPEQLVRFGTKLQEAARLENRPDFLCRSSLPLETDAQAKELGIIASGFSGFFTFYSGDVPESSLYLGIESFPEAARIPRTAQLVETVLSTGLSMFDVQHQPAIEAYLGRPDRINRNKWEWTIRGTVLRLVFDEHNRISQIEFGL